MFSYILKRIFAGILTMLVLVTVTFGLTRIIPGGPFSPAEERKTPPEVIEAINKRYGLDRPVSVQYVRYMKNLVRGDLGVSFQQLDVSVNDIIKRGFPVSARVGATAVLTALAFGLCFGIISAVRRGRWMDNAAMVLATVGISIPSFILTVFMLFLFTVVLKLLPTYGLTSWKHYLLPVIGLAAAPLSYITRLMRSSMLEVMRQDYIRTARSKGLGEFGVITRHAMKNAVIPVVTYLGPLVAALLTGSFVIERIFSIPGIGRDYVSSIADRDYAIILGMTIFFGALVVLMNIVVDIVYAIIDPRVRIDE